MPSRRQSPFLQASRRMAAIGRVWYREARELVCRRLLHLVFLGLNRRLVLVVPMRLLDLGLGGNAQPVAEEHDGKHADDHPENNDEKNRYYCPHMSECLDRKSVV